MTIVDGRQEGLIETFMSPSILLRLSMYALKAKRKRCITLTKHTLAIAVNAKTAQAIHLSFVKILDGKIPQPTHNGSEQRRNFVEDVIHRAEMGVLLLVDIRSGDLGHWRAWAESYYL